MMTKTLITFVLLTCIFAYAEPINDQDFDGVPDSIDKCPKTPFLNTVNAQGCTEVVLLLPEETEKDSLTLTIGYGYSTNEDLIGREKQRTSKIQLSYYYDDWSYSVRAGHYAHNEGNGLIDTSFKIKKRFKLYKNLKLGLGIGIKLPNYDFIGNKTDYTFYSSLNYYPTSSLSIFTGYSYAIINDEKIITPLQNTHSAYLGVGYFFKDDFYANITYAYSQSKFTKEHSIKTLGSTLYHKINTQWFTTLSYSREFDDDLHDALNLKIGYKFW